jgi:mycothiol synthase
MLEFIAESPPSAAFDHEAWARVYNATQAEVAYHVYAEELKRGDEIRPKDLYARRVLAREHGEVVGCGLAMNLAYAFNPQRLWVWVSVPPQHQGRGVGAAIFSDLLQAAHPVVRPTQLMCRVKEDAHASLRFLARRGFTTRLKQVPSALQLDHLDLSPLPALRARLLRDGVEIMSLSALRDRDPDWVHKYWALNADIEARLPSPVPVTPLALDFFVKTILEAPSLCWEATHVAVTADACVGLTVLRTVQGAPTCRETGLTGVRVAYQRKGIATALKLAAAQRAAAEGALTIMTENAAINPMLSLNVALGFVPQVPIQLMFSDLPTSPDGPDTRRHPSQ